MSRWWRAYDEAVDDPKLQRLGPKLGWAWFNLMCVASANGGVLPSIGDVAFKLRITDQQAAALIAELATVGLFDRLEDGRYAPHNWDGRQYITDRLDKTNAQRQAEFRKRRKEEFQQLKAVQSKSRNGVRNALRNGVTSVCAKRPDTDTDIITTTVSEDTGVGLSGGVATAHPLATSVLVASLQNRARR